MDILIETVIRHFSKRGYETTSGTSEPRQRSHPSCWRCLSAMSIASSAFRKPTPAYRISLSTQHTRPSGFFDCRSDRLKLITWWTQISSVWFWQF